MYAIVLLSALCLGPVDEDALLARLDASVESLLHSDPRAEEMRKAISLLEGTNSSDRWTNYSQALKILRETRSKAGIPLLLAYTVRHAKLSSSHAVIPQYAATITILSGKTIPDPYRSGKDRQAAVRQAVEKLVSEWWTPECDRIMTDIDEWSPHQLQVLGNLLLEGEASQLRGQAIYRDNWKDQPTAYALYHVLYYHVMHRSTSRPPDWRIEELHPEMLAVWLAPAHYQLKPLEPPRRDTSQPAYGAVAMLAALRSQGELQELDEIVEDPNQTAGVRLTCVMALFRAGEKLRTPILISLAESGKSLEQRLVAILALRYAEGDRRAGTTLTKLLDEENAEIRTAAICALRGPLPPPAVPKLQQAIDTLDPRQAMTFVFDVLGEYKTREACEVLVGFLKAGLEDRRKDKYLGDAISGLERATGKRWNQAGPQSDDFYREQARAAIAWWESEGRRRFAD
jgi:hypothetical protein